MSRFSKVKLHLPGKITAVLALSTLALCLALVLGRAPKVEAACAPATSFGTDTLTVTTPSATTYTVWVRMMSPDGKSNQIDLSVDGGTCETMNGGTMAANAWVWVDSTTASSSPLTMSLTAGTHTIVLTGTQTGMGVDNILLLGDNTCVPTGTGTNCTPVATAPTISITAPITGTTVSGSVAINATATDTAGVSKVVFTEGSTTIATDTASPYSATWDTTTVPNGSYTITATATDASGLTASATTKVTVSNQTTTKPTTPSGLTAAATAFNSVNLSWGASTDPAGVTGYNILRGTGTGAPTTITSVSGTTLSYTDNTVQGSTAYTYEVEAFDAANLTSAASSPASVTTPAAPSSNPPTVTVTAPLNGATASGTVNIAATASDQVGVTKVEFLVDGVVASTLTAPNGTAGNYTYAWDSTAASQGSHTITVTAFDAAGLTDSVDIAVTVSNPGSTLSPPTAPTNVVATAATASNSVTLTWGTSTDTSASIAGYYVLRASGSNATTGYTNIASVPVSSSSTGLTYVDSSVAASTAYSYEIEAFVAGPVASPPSTAVSVTTSAPSTTNPGGTAPSSPTGVTATPSGPTQVNLTWTGPCGCDGVVSYTISENGTQIATGVTTPSYGVSGLQPNTTYTFTIVATNSVGKSAPSTPASCTTPAQTTTGHRRGRVTDRDGHGIGHVRVRCDGRGGDSSSFTYTDKNGNYTISDISPGKQTFHYSSFTSSFKSTAITTPTTDTGSSNQQNIVLNSNN